MSNIEAGGSSVGTVTDLAHDVLRQRRQPLDAIFAPRNVAVIGATERPGSVGRTILSNLLANPQFAGRIFPINPKRPTVLEHAAYPSIGAIPGPIDLAVIATPAETMPDVIAQCVAARVSGAIVVSAGFREVGQKGVELERSVLAEARRSGMRIIGPNCLGVMNPLIGLNATFAAGIARPGNVAFLSQSGALCTAILDWSLRELVGFSAFVSTGTMLDVGWGDLIDYFGNDPTTKSILIYMESSGDARSFLSAAREVALSKPIIVIKAGRTEAAAKAAASHTGALTGGDDVIDAAFRRAGVLRVNNIADLFYMAEVLARQPRPSGPRLTILTNAGGPGVLAADALILAGGELAQVSPQTVEALNTVLPPQWSHGNPIDVLGDAGPERYAKALEVAARDPGGDGLLVILTPQDMTDPTRTAEALQPFSKIRGKPLLASWMGGPGVQAGIDALNQAAIPTFSYPDTAARAFHYMWRYTYNLRSLYETPALPKNTTDIDSATAESIIATALENRRTLMSEAESKQILFAYGIPTVTTTIAPDVDAALRAAQSTGYPVVLKLFSSKITHKSDVGGVRLNLSSPEQVRQAFQQIRNALAERAPGTAFEGVTVQRMVRDPDAFEIIIGSSIDAQFGPVLLFGAGGILVELNRDRALGLPPLNTTLAMRMMEQTTIFRAFKGIRGRKPVDLGALSEILVRFSRLVTEQPRIQEIDVNPLLVSGSEIVALDARVLLFPHDMPEDRLPRPAIRSYPSHYQWRVTMRNGQHVLIRPIRPEDENLLVQFHERLSERSVHDRYFHAVKLKQRIAHDRLIRICFADYDRELALVAEHADAATGECHILGVARLSRLRDGSSGEFALLIADQWQHQGLGTQMLGRLIQVARNEHFQRLTARILVENYEMRCLCHKLGFQFASNFEDGLLRAELKLA